MPDPTRTAPIEDLLAHADWLRALARRLVTSEDVASDVEQETWLAALEHPPRDAAAPRQWLAQVLRNVVKQHRRSESARRLREACVARPEAHAGSEETVDRAQALRTLIEAVLELDEPYRSTLLLRYQDGLSTEAVAIQQGVPASTVRNRQSRGLALLRERLEHRHGEAWGALLVPLVHEPSIITAAVTAGGGALGASVAAILSMATLKLVSAAVAALVIGGILWWSLTDSTPAIPSTAMAPSAARTEPAFAKPSEATTSERAIAEAPKSESAQQAAATSARRGSLAVRVTWESDGTPAADVLVRVHAWGESSPFAFATVRTTDAQGLARFDDVASGLAAVGTDRAEGDMLQVRGGEVTEVALTIPRGVLVRGTVVDSADSPVAFARIWLSQYGNDSEGGEVGRADASGRFTLRDLGEARFIAARAAGFAPSWSTRVDAKPGDEVELVLKMFPNGGELRGIVRTPDGTPLVGAALLIGYEELAWKGTRDGIDQRSAPPQRLSTDEHGEFAASGIASGRTKLECRAHGFAPFARGVEVAADGVSRIAIDLQPGAEVIGSVRDVDGKPAAGVQIGIGKDATFSSSHATTAEDGSFRLCDLAPGPTAIRIGGDARGEAQATLTLVAGETAHLDVQLEKHGIVAGRVIDEAGAPLVGWRVEAVPADPSGQHRRTSVTDARGQFTLDNWPAQAHALEVTEANRRNAPPALVVPSVAIGRTDLVITIPADSMVSATLIGRLVGPGGQVVADARFLWGERGGTRKYFAEMNSATGEFRAEMQPGFYELQAQSPSIGTFDLPVRQVHAGETLDLGVVRFGAPGRVRVKLVPPQEMRDTFDRRTVSVDLVDPNLRYFGQIELDDKLEGLSSPLSVGPYVVRVMSQTLRAPRTRVEVIAGEERVVELALEPSTMRSVRVAWASGSPPKEFLNFKVTDAAGNVFLEGMLPVEEGGSTTCALTQLVVGKFSMEVTTPDGRSGRASFEVHDLARSRELIEIQLR